MSTIISHSEIETKEIAKDFTLTLRSGDVVTLTGELGAGKTAFTKGIAEALGVKKEIVSPTFAIMNVYEVNFKSIKQLVHIDTYRLKSAEELREIGADEYISVDDTVTIIEWPEIASALLPKKIISVEILHGDKHNERKITINQ